jgi:hypothetical protein
MSGGQPGLHGIQGIGDGSKFLVDLNEVDDIIVISTEDAIKRAKESADQASGISGPKTYNTETGKWEAYQLKEQPKYEPAKISEPKPITKGAELSRASTKDMVDERSAKTGITVNQNTMSTPTSDSTKGKYSSGDVGIVEPVDARLRLKELFGMSSTA